ncbi:thioredoxin [Cognaticolwellia aestuarii]|uniref:thioredoxin n=1 Tax=Cognaticolwellia aestuarii TaxID=329993 RepID=UPI00098573D9|nr:thioredoxin [Cognaticolwellia aestuarii]
MNVEEIRSEQHFNDVLASSSDVLIDFWASWCGPCKSMTPVFEQVANEKVAELKAIKVNIDDIPSLAQKYGIRSIPSLLLLKNKLVTSEHLGAASKSDVIEWLNEH